MTSLTAGTGATPPLTLSFGYPATQNNGNLSSQTINHAGTVFTQNYTGYDGANRLTVASEGANWAQSYAYDKRGNRAVIAAGSYIPLPIYTPQIPTAGSAMPYSGNSWNGGSYDFAGNQTAIVGGVYNFFYDAENRQRRAVQSGTPAVTTDYTYDGDGKRITRTTGSAVTTFVYDAAGNLAAEYGPAAAPACQVSSPFVRATCFLTTDHLGSVRMVTDAAGTVISRHDYLPFGEEIPASVGNRSAVAGYGSGDGVPERFTGKERDGETGLDYFGARYYSGAQGRFTSPDPINANILRVINPQRWNMYAYAVNNPLAFADPDGRDAIAVNFSKLAGGAGHSAVISVHRDGTATFGEYGPRGGGKMFFPGQYTVRPLQTKVAFASDGTPTSDSYGALLNELAGDEGQPEDSISFAHFKTAEWETAALDAYLEAARQQQLKGDAPFYAVGFNDCRDFCLAGLRSAAVDYGHTANANISPNWIISILSGIADSSYANGKKTTIKPGKYPRASVKSTICYEGQAGCSAK